MFEISIHNLWPQFEEARKRLEKAGYAVVHQRSLKSGVNS
jgi:hypothetical protein